MIKINIQTNELTRESIPANLRRLSTHTLNNLQTELDPVPDDLIDIEYWNESPVSTQYNQDTQRLGNEILTADLVNRVVNVSHEVINLTAQESTDRLNAAKDKLITELTAKSESVAGEDLTLNGMTFTTDIKSINEITSSLSIMGRNPTETIDFRGVNGWAVANKAALEGMQDAVWNKRKATNANHKAHEDAITALTTVQLVNDYDISTGW